MNATDLIAQLREYASNPGYSHNDYADTMREAADMLAERAVSPAESVQSLHDDHQFQIVLDDYVDISADHREEKTSWDEANKAYKAVLTYIDASRAAAHAEGRRSAMEELAKEKERADRADNALKEWLDKTQWVQDAVQSNKFSVMYLGHHRADVIRQEFDKLAQPLQQEGGKEESEEMEDPILIPRGLIGAACYLIRKHAPDSKLLGKLREFTVGSRSGYIATQPADNLQQASTTDIRSAALEDAAAHCDKFGHSRVDAASLAADIRMLKPSENDADPAEDAWLADRLGKLLAGVAVALKGPEPARKRWSYHDLPEIAAKVMLELELHRAKEAAQATPPAHETIVAEAGELVCTACGTTAQATPEGAELPPLPKGKTFITTVPCEISNMFTPEDMHAYARAAIVGSQQAGPDWRAIAEGHALNAATLQEELDALKAADPVAWLTECIKGDRRGQFELAEPNEKASNPDYWSDAFPVYRAAPPQQVDTGGLPG